MNTPDDEFVMLSALQHYLFCPRQCALIHVEGAWSENYLTAAGRVLHERVDARERVPPVGGASRIGRCGLSRGARGLHVGRELLYSQP